MQPQKLAIFTFLEIPLAFPYLRSDDSIAVITAATAVFFISLRSSAFLHLKTLLLCVGSFELHAAGPGILHTSSA